MLIHGEAIGLTGFTNNASVINFDDLTGGSCITCGPVVTNQYSASGVTFNNPTFPTMDTVTTFLAPYIPNTSSPNTLFVYQGGMMGDAPADPLQILFSVPVTMVGFDYGSTIDSFLRLDAYDKNNQLIETLFFTGDSAPIGLAGFAGIEESTPIARLDISYHPNSDPCRTYNFSLDNLRFESTPEPATPALLLTGLLGMALARRRRCR